MGFLGPNFSYNNFLKQFQQLTGTGTAGLGAGIPGLPGQGPMGSPALNNLTASMLFQQMMALQTNLSPRETSLLLKSILELPKEIQTLFALLATQNTKPSLQQQALKQLLEDNPDLKISLEDLQALLGEKTKESANKLIRLIQSNQGAAYSGDSQKLTELLKMTTQMVGRAAASPTEALNTVMLLYIPWYPLIAQQRLELYFEEQGDGGEGGAEGDGFTLVLYLETNTLGKFKISAGAENRIQLIFKVEHDPEAKPFLKEIDTNLTEALAKDGLPAPAFDFGEVARPSTDPGILDKKSGIDEFETFRADTKKVSVYPSSGVSVVVLNGAYQLARVIFEIDERNGVLQKRALNQKS